ncbi:hypothetical protein VTK73DRAFT_5424 [Phialemonium thermophilum]|uniref:BCS1 N-terminal domain-containing protein n=1 Tax=Phialemonium thermophilum TaxID=223376 RepID=A0ABR3V1X3_9PEZI
MDCGHGGAMPNPTSSTLPLAETGAPQLVLLDFFFPGFSVVSGALQKYLHIDINLYLPIVLLCGVVVFLWGYVSNYAWDAVQNYLMSTVEIRVDDELYNYVMAWVAAQRFAQGARQFIANTNLNSRSRTLWRYTYDDDDDDDDAGDGSGGKKEKTLAYTPSFGTHYFWYRGRLLVFRRSQTRDGGASLTVSEKEEISLCCFGRNPRILKELLHEARDRYVQQDERKTLIYRGTARSEYADPVWQRSMARDARPFSTVILDEAVKRDLVADVRDYLHPATRRWYANRGIPYRRGYLLYGPPGTGKSTSTPRG